MQLASFLLLFSSAIAVRVDQVDTMGDIEDEYTSLADITAENTADKFVSTM